MTLVFLPLSGSAQITAMYHHTRLKRARRLNWEEALYLLDSTTHWAASQLPGFASVEKEEDRRLRGWQLCRLSFLWHRASSIGSCLLGLPAG